MRKQKHDSQLLRTADRNMRIDATTPPEQQPVQEQEVLEHCSSGTGIDPVNLKAATTARMKERRIFDEITLLRIDASRLPADFRIDLPCPRHSFGMRKASDTSIPQAKGIWELDNSMMSGPASSPGEANYKGSFGSGKARTHIGNVLETAVDREPHFGSSYFMESSVNEVFLKFNLKVFNLNALAGTCRVVNHTTQMRKHKHDSPSFGVSPYQTKQSVQPTMPPVDYACIARAAFFQGAGEGTLTISDRHRHCQLGSSNNNEDEGETHSL
ncbi:hypothetical protein DFJ58DRAFT_844929 [Suillus subalutaceus]|uniref:uncharacterized protein n=1 Tax=Suillus subalutaceus TaxID=48586 RepID=UPI001B883692|nr:uncharacterized protein DFJ58DRAFT_844929 [Suillus subalutaceus]KAG1841676.1 hypothetical protein DFJ58DRAFT_844929 [Suillus subalutaceus]